MRAFANAGYQLRNARLEVRLVYSGFLALVAIGLATMAAMQWTHIGPWPAQIAAYYRGGERAGAMMFPKTFRELIEMTHFHAFIMGTVYLIMAHLLIATSVSDRVKRWAIVGGFCGLLGDLTGVWLVRYVSAHFAWWQLASWIVEWTSFSIYCVVPLREMWSASGAGADGGD